MPVETPFIILGQKNIHITNRTLTKQELKDIGYKKWHTTHVFLYSYLHFAMVFGSINLMILEYSYDLPLYTLGESLLTYYFVALSRGDLRINPKVFNEKMYDIIK